MEQWQINTLNKCARDGNLPKGIPFKKEQIIAMLGINPAEFILLQKENFIARTTPDGEDFTTTDRWEMLKAMASGDALLTAENKDKPVAAPVATAPPAPAAPAQKPVAAEQPKSTPPAPPAATPTPKPQAEAPKAAPVPAKETTVQAATPAKEKPAAATYTPTAKGTEKEGMDLTSILSLIGVAVGVLIIILSVLKK